MAKQIRSKQVLNLPRFVNTNRGLHTCNTNPIYEIGTKFINLSRGSIHLSHESID